MKSVDTAVSAETKNIFDTKDIKRKIDGEGKNKTRKMNTLGTKLGNRNQTIAGSSCPSMMVSAAVGGRSRLAVSPLFYTLSGGVR